MNPPSHYKIEAVFIKYSMWMNNQIKEKYFVKAQKHLVKNPLTYIFVAQ